MSKENISASVDPEVAEYLSQDHVNASGLINDLVKRHMNGGSTDDLLREFRIQQLEDEFKDKAASARRKLEERNRLLEAQERDEEESQNDLVEFVEWMDVNNEYVFEDHERVADLANEHFDGDRAKTIQELKATADAEGYDFEDRRFGL